MPSLDWSQCPGVERIPGKVSGAWVFTGTRTPVAIDQGNWTESAISVCANRTRTSHRSNTERREVSDYSQS